MLRLRRIALAAPLFLLVACASPMGTASSTAPQHAVTGPWGVDLTAMDLSVKPGDDFFRYTSGAWMKTAVIPADRTSWGVTAMVRDKAERDTKAVIDENAAATHEPGSVGQQVADFNAAFLDTAAIDAKGLGPAKPDLDAIAAAKSHDELVMLMAKPGMPGGPIAFSINPDSKNPDRYLVDVTQSGLGLPDRDYYLRKDKQFADIRAAYRAYIAQMLTMAGYPQAEKAAGAVLALETGIAQDSWAIEKRRDLDAVYNYKTRAEVAAFAPGYPFEAMYAGLELPAGYDRFNVDESTAVQTIAKHFTGTPLATWKAYMTFHYLDGNASVLPKAYDDASFAFNGAMLNGQKQQRERWKRSISAMGGVMGEAVGQLYVTKNFTPEAKAAMLELVENMRAAYKRRIEALDWMGADTRAKALEKLAAFHVKIGYPDHWKDYTSLTIKADDALGNTKRLTDFEWHRQLARIDRPVDKAEWFLSPQTVNAYNNGNFNEIVFPAAILQPPIFDLAADPAVNYGAIASIIGHEMGHGFDDQGSKIDARGVQTNWWTKADEDRFKARTHALSAQYSKFEPLPGIHVNGDLTLGENIGDLGGIQVALDAYHHLLGGKPAPVIDGFTGDQRFFLGYAQTRKSIYRDAALRNQVLSDPHSPNEYRTNGIVPNVDEWYASFAVTPDAKLYIAPDKRVHIW